LPEDEAVEMVRKIGGTCVRNQRSTTFDISKKVGPNTISLHLTVLSTMLLFMGGLQPGLEDLFDGEWHDVQLAILLPEVSALDVDVGLAKPLILTCGGCWNPTFSVRATTLAELAVIVQRIFKVDI
jgi:hypothetical protein